MTTTTAAAKPMPSHLLDQDGKSIESPPASEIADRLKAGKFFWLDIPDVGDDEVALLRDTFGLHPLVLDDAEHFGERPKLEDFDDYSVLVLYGTAASVPDTVYKGGDPVHPAPAPPDHLVGQDRTEVDLSSTAEVHAVVAEKFLVTIHRGVNPSLREQATRARSGNWTFDRPAVLVNKVADILVDSFFPILGELDDRIDSLNTAVVEHPTNDQLQELLRYRTLLNDLRRVVGPQRDIFSSLSSGIATLPGFTDDDNRYIRDVYDHLIHLSDLIDSYRDLLSGTTDAYLSVVSNQLNVVMKQLSVIATVFLPLSFLTGFFGQNFSWLVGGLNGIGKFIVLGLGTELVAVAVMFVFFRRKGWLGNQT